MAFIIKGITGLRKETLENNTAPLPAFHVLIVAGGSGTRMAHPIPKQYMPLCGQAIIRHSVEMFLGMEACASVRVVIGADDADWYAMHLGDLVLPDPVIGGECRRRSVFNGLNAMPEMHNDDLVLVHDAARACVDVRDIYALLQALSESRAATLAIPVSSSLRRGDDANIAHETVARDGLWEIQTPQAFRYGDLLKAHEAADNNVEYTDDTALVSAIDIPVKLVKGSAQNIKITHPSDIDMAERILAGSHITLSGMGFDVHAFDDAREGPVRLCGIDVVHSHALKGHSDADVALHALTDAILGAISAGDIGVHFPPSNDAFKDMDSVVFLEKALGMLEKRKGRLQNIDLTIICEAPKIGPYAPQMRQRLMDICGLPEQRINVKATTTEGLGFTGRGEGIAAQALVTINIPEDLL